MFWLTVRKERKGVGVGVKMSNVLTCREMYVCLASQPALMGVGWGGGLDFRSNFSHCLSKSCYTCSDLSTIDFCPPPPHHYVFCILVQWPWLCFGSRMSLCPLKASGISFKINEVTVLVDWQGIKLTSYLRVVGEELYPMDLSMG